MKLLIVYGTTEGHTRTIAERIGDWTEARGHKTTVVDSAHLWSGLAIRDFDGFIVMGSLHMEKHQASLIHFVKDNLELLSSKPSAFLSASMTAVLDDEESQAAARRCINKFTDETEWAPTVSMPVAGALLYTQYDFLKRMILKMISKKQGGPTDTSRDYEFTDWTALKQFLTDFLAKYVEAQEHAGAAVS